MTKKLYYWAENLENYSSDIDKSFPLSIEIKRLNFFIGKNNSGKSRFVRNLFTNSSYTISDYSFPDLTDFFTELKIIFENTHGSLWIGNTSSGSDRSTLLNSIQDVINFPTYPKGKYKDNYSKNISLLAKARFEHTTVIEDKVKEIEKYVSDYESTLISEDNKFYIPVLRGMRPVTDITNNHI